MDNSNDAALDLIIETIREYFKRSLDLPNFDDFLEDKKIMFSNNLYGVQDFAIEDLRLLFLTIYQNPETSNPELREVFFNKGQSFEKEVVVSLSYDLYHNENTLVRPFFLWAFSELKLITRPSTIWLMSHSDKINILKINKPNKEQVSLSISGNLESKIVKVPFNFQNLLSQVLSFYPKYSFNKNFIEFRFGIRIVGVNVTRSKPRFPHLLEFKQNENDATSLLIRIDDNVACKNLELIHDSKSIPIKSTYQLNDKYFDIITNALVSKLDTMKNPQKRIQLVFQIARLNDYFEFFLARDVKDKIASVMPPKKTKQITAPHTFEVVYPETWTKTRTIKLIPCEHTEKLKDALHPNPKQFENLQAFSDIYVTANDDVAVCKLCGEHLDMFNEQFSEIKKINGKIAIPVFSNIFANEPYSQFFKAQHVLNGYIMSFDNIFKTKRWNYNGNIYKLILDYMFEIDKKKTEYQNQYRQEIQKGLFFVRLAANLFETKNDELYYRNKVINISVLVTLSIIATMNLDEFMSVISQKKQIDAYVQAGSDFSKVEKLIKNTCMEMIYDFLTRIKLVEKIEREMIGVIYEFYYYHLTNELQVLFDSLKENVMFGMTTVVGLNNVYDFGSNVLRSDFGEIGEMVKVDDIYFSYNVPTAVGINLDAEPPVSEDFNYSSADTSISVDVIRDQYENIKSQIKYAIMYNETLVMDHAFSERQVYIVSHNRKKKYIDIDTVCEKVPLTYEGNVNMAFLKFGDPFPFSHKISESHLNLKITGWNYLARNAFDFKSPIQYFGIPDDDDMYDRDEIEFWWTALVMRFMNISNLTELLNQKSNHIISLYTDFF